MPMLAALILAAAPVQTAPAPQAPPDAAIAMRLGVNPDLLCFVASASLAQQAARRGQADRTLESAAGYFLSRAADGRESAAIAGDVAALRRSGLTSLQIAVAMQGCRRSFLETMQRVQPLLQAEMRDAI